LTFGQGKELADHKVKGEEAYGIFMVEKMN